MHLSFSYELAETYGLESESILQTAKLWRKNVNGIIGPQETCNHEARYQQLTLYQYLPFKHNIQHK